MLQIFVMLSPFAQQRLTDKQETMIFLEELEEAIVSVIASEWKWSKSSSDFRCSAMNLIYTHGEADVQVEFCTAVADEYGTENPKFFEDQEDMCEKIGEAIRPIVKPLDLTYSVWTKSLRDSCFRPGPVRGAV